MADHDHDDHHHHHHDNGSELSETQLRVRALESILTEKGYVDPAALDLLIEAYETKIGPHRGARAIAKAWADPEFKSRLLEDASDAVDALGFTNPVSDHLVAVENTERLHNMIVCTLCSCYPWSVLGLPPRWYKSPEYRARMVREPRNLLREMGLDLPPEVEIRVWDSSAEKRYMVLPQCPTDETMTEEQLAGLVTRDSMVGVARL